MDNLTKKLDEARFQIAYIKSRIDNIKDMVESDDVKVQLDIIKQLLGET